MYQMKSLNIKKRYMIKYTPIIHYINIFWSQDSRRTSNWTLLQQIMCFLGIKCAACGYIDSSHNQYFIWIRKQNLWSYEWHPDCSDLYVLYVLYAIERGVFARSNGTPHAAFYWETRTGYAREYRGSFRNFFLCEIKTVYKSHKLNLSYWGKLGILQEKTFQIQIHNILFGKLHHSFRYNTK